MPVVKTDLAVVRSKLNQASPFLLSVFKSQVDINGNGYPDLMLPLRNIDESAGGPIPPETRFAANQARLFAVCSAGEATRENFSTLIQEREDAESEVITVYLQRSGSRRFRSAGLVSDTLRTDKWGQFDCYPLYSYVLTGLGIDNRH